MHPVHYLQRPASAEGDFGFNPPVRTLTLELSPSGVQQNSNRRTLTRGIPMKLARTSDGHLLFVCVAASAAECSMGTAP
jgi:hypothetical protein